MEKLADILDFNKYKKEDIITTITEFTAYGISYSYLNFLKNVDVVVVSGGGSHNKYLMQRIYELTKFKVITGEQFGINSDAKEAFGFVVMGYMTLKHKPSNLPSATGAKEDVILGDITIW